MKTFFQKITAQLPSIFHKEPVKKLPPQNSTVLNSRQKTALAALTTFLTLGPAYWSYRYLFPKMNIPVSSSSIGTAFTAVGSMMGLAGAAGLLNIKKTSNTLNNDKLKSTHSDVIRLLDEFHAGETINNDLLEELFLKYNDLSSNSPKESMSNELFILDIINSILKYKESFFKHSTNLDEKKSILNKIIDILNFFTDRTDPLSCGIVKDLFSNRIIPNELYEVTQMFIELEDSKSKELADRSLQLIYKTLTQHIKILFSDDIEFGTEYRPNKVFPRILELLTPSVNNDFRLSPNFYANFIQYSPQFTWRFVNEYILEYVISHQLPIKMEEEVSPENLIANVLNARNKYRNDEEDPHYTDKDGLDVLIKILNGAKRSLFLDDQDQGAASFAIRFMQQLLEINPKKFEEENPNDSELLKQLYFDLCSLKDLEFYINFTKENDLSKQTASIANELIKYYEMNFFEHELFGVGLRHSFFKTLIPLYEKEYSDEDKTLIRYLSCYITNQIINPSMPHQIKLASLALNKYSKVFHNEESINLIKEAYHTKAIKNPELDSACQKFINNCENLPETNEVIKTELKTSEITDCTKEDEKSDESDSKKNCSLK